MYFASKDMEKEEYLGLNRYLDEKKVEERDVAVKKRRFYLRVHPKLRIPLIWTIVFIIIGITIESIKSGSFFFSQFFFSSYVEWFRGFGNFVDLVNYGTELELLALIARKWYYFFYTGGLISIIIAILYILMHKEIKPELEQEERVIKPEKQKILIVKQEAGNQAEKIPTKNFQDVRIEKMIIQGEDAINEGDMSKARGIYQEIQKMYDYKKDYKLRLYAKIINFFIHLSKGAKVDDSDNNSTEKL